jgi:hypothetical protein
MSRDTVPYAMSAAMTPRRLLAMARQVYVSEPKALVPCGRASLGAGRAVARRVR